MARPDLTITKTHHGQLRAGAGPARYTITVTNSGTGRRRARHGDRHAARDSPPSSLTGDARWSCTLSDADVHAQRAPDRRRQLSSRSRLTVTVAANAPASVTNTATVAAGGEIKRRTTRPRMSHDDRHGERRASTSRSTKTHTGNFTQGQTGATYTITVSKHLARRPRHASQIDGHRHAAGRPDGHGVHRHGWTCIPDAGPHLHAQRSARRRRERIRAHADGECREQRARERHQHGDGLRRRRRQRGNNTRLDATTIGARARPDDHEDAHRQLHQGQTGATYTITVTNSGGGATSGAVTVTDALPAASRPRRSAGTGWTLHAGDADVHAQRCARRRRRAIRRSR